MGEIKTVVSGDVTVRKIIGSITLQEVMSVLQEFYSGQPTKFVVWDISAGSVPQLTSKDIDKIASFVSSHSQTRIGGKTALVASSDLEFGISRMLDIHSELKNLPFEVKTFRKLSDAAKWIGVDDLPIVEG